MENDRLVGAAQTRRFFDDISDMTLWRWLENEELGFPRPIYINRKRYWRMAELQSFSERMKQMGAPEKVSASQQERAAVA